MKKTILFTVIGLTIYISVYSQRNVPNTLSGSVTDAKTSLPLANASVYISDLRLGVVADSTGNYVFRNLPSGNFLVQVHSVGYKTALMNVSINGSTTENFQLTENIVEESEVVVTGVTKATQLKRNPVPIVAIDHDYLVTNLNTNAIDAISKIPGVRAVTTGPNVSKPFIRGLGFNRILTLYDGLRQEGQQWGDEHGIEVDQYSVERAEVIKGPASLSYGSDALAGVVNLIPTQPAPEGKTLGDVIAEYQTNNKYIGGSAMIGSTHNGFEWLGRFSHKQAVDYKNKVDGRVFGTAFNETDANATLGVHRKWGFSRLNLVLFDDLQEIPDGSRDSLTYKFTRQITEADSVRPIVSDQDLNSYKIEVLHQRVQHYRIFSSNNFIFGNSGSLLVNFGFQRSVRREFSHPEVPYQNVAGLFLQLNTFTYDVKYALRNMNGWDATLGVNGMYQRNVVTKGTEFVIPSYRQFDIGPFITVKKTFDKLDVAGGVRYDIRRFNNDALYTVPDPVSGFDTPVPAGTPGADNPFSDYSHTFAGASGSFGATYNFTPKIAIKANVARGFRAPNIAEISANGVHPGTNFYQIGNPNFKPEFNWQEDVGFLFASKSAEIQVNLFNNFINNFIYDQKLLTASGQDSVSVPGTPQTFKFVASRANLYGGELSIDIHPVKDLHFENSLSVVYSLNKGAGSEKAVSDSEKYLPFTPPLHGISELRLDWKTGAIREAFVKVQLEYYATQNRVYTAFGTETPTPGYALLNAGVGGGISNKRGKTIFKLYIMGNNLLNNTYWDHLNRLKYFYAFPGDPREHGIYNMGSNVTLKLDVPLDFSSK
jgi:iron complex outermembrane recepter protein